MLHRLSDKTLGALSAHAGQRGEGECVALPDAWHVGAAIHADSEPVLILERVLKLNVMVFPTLAGCESAASAPPPACTPRMARHSKCAAPAPAAVLASLLAHVGAVHGAAGLGQALPALCPLSMAAPGRLTTAGPGRRRHGQRPHMSKEHTSTAAGSGRALVSTNAYAALQVNVGALAALPQPTMWRRLLHEHGCWSPSSCNHGWLAIAARCTCTAHMDRNPVSYLMLSMDVSAYLHRKPDCDKLEGLRQTRTGRSASTAC